MNLNDFRQKIPQLNGLDDQAALDLLHKHYYPDVDKQRMADVLGVKTPPPPVPERSMARAAGDLGLQFAGGAVSGVRMMSDLFGANNAVSGGLRSAEDALRELQSAAAKADQQRIAEIMKEAESKGFGDQVIAGVKAFGQAPAAMIAQALGTSIPTLATALIPGVGQGAMAARLAAGAGVGAAQGAGNIKGVIYDEVMGKPLAGETQEQTKARAEAAQAYGSENTGQIALGGVLGAAAGSTGMERALSGLRNGVTQAAPGMVARVGMGAAAEAVPEIAQGGQEKLASNLALRNEGFDVDPMAGVVAGATMEGLAGGLTGGVTAIPRPHVIGEREPVPQPAPVPPVEPPGPMTKAVQALGFNPIAGTPVVFPDGSVALGSEAEQARRDELSMQSNIEQEAARRAPMPAGDAYNMLATAQERGLDYTVALHPSGGGFLVVPKQWITPQAQEAAASQLMETIGRMREADAAPVERAERRRSEPVDLNLNTDPVAGYIEDLRNTNTPAARAYVGEFDAGRVTRADVEQRMQADRGKTPDERLAEAAAEGLKFNKNGDPFKTLMAANLEAKKTTGTVIEVAGGYAIRPQESTLANTQAQGETYPAAIDTAAEAGAGAGEAAALGGDQPGAVEALSNEQDAPQQPARAEAQAAPDQAPEAARGDGAAGAGVPATRDAGQLVTAGLTLEVGGRFYPVDSLEQASEMRFKARKQFEKQKAAGKAGGFIEDAPIRDGAGRIVGYVGRGDSVFEVPNAGPTAKKLYDAAKADAVIGNAPKLPAPAAPGAGGVQADGVSPAWAGMTPDQRKRSRLEQEIATGTTNNGGVVGKLRPSAIEKRKQELAQMGDAGWVPDLSKNPQNLNTFAEPSQETAKSEQVEPFEHAGLKIRPSRVKVGDDVQNRWIVQSPENAEREARGERQIGGDRIVDSREQAIKTAEQEAKRYAEEKTRKSEIDAREKAERDAAEAKKEANRGKTLLERRAEAILDKEVRDGETGKVMKRRDWVAGKVKAGAKTSVTQEDKIKPMTRMQAFRADNRQQAEHDRKVKEAGKKDVYWLDGFEVTKTEYDHANKLMAEEKPASKAAQEPTQKEESTGPWSETKNNFTDRPVFRYSPDPRIHWATVQNPSNGVYVVEYRMGDKVVSTEELSDSLTAIKFHVAGKVKELDATQATHKDPGEKPEAATKGVVTDSLKTAAKNEDTKPSEMRKWLLGEIDKAIKDAPDYSDFEALVKTMGEKDAISSFTGNGLFGKNAETGSVTFDVPGDGKFKVRNSVRGLLEFRKNVSASLGFKDNGQRTVAPAQNDGAQAGSGGRMAAITNMIEEGDFEAARDYAEAVGISLDDVKVPRGERKGQWDQFRKDGTLPPPPDTRPLPTQKTPAQVAEDARLAEEAKDKEEQDSTPSLDLKGFERVPNGNGYFDLRDGNMTVRVEPMGKGKFQASFRGAKSSPHLQGEQGAVDWSAAYREESQRAEAKEEAKPFTPPEGYKPAGEPFYRGGKLVQGYAPFAPGERVTMKDSAGQSGVVESLIKPDDNGVFESAAVRFDNGTSQAVPLGKLVAANEQAAPAATGPRRDPAKVSMFNPYEDGDIVTINGQDWTVKQDTPGWYITNTGNWRGQHPTIRNIKAMADLIRAVEQAANAAPATQEPETPKLTKKDRENLDQALLDGTVSIQDYMDQVGLSDKDIGLMDGDGLRAQADREAKAADPYHQGIQKIQEALTDQMKSAMDAPLSTPQQRKSKEERYARITRDRSTLDMIARGYEHPFDNRFVTKLSAILKARFNKQWAGIKTGEFAKQAYQQAAYKLYAQKIIEAARKKAGEAAATPQPKKALPPLPVEQYRVEKHYANGAKIKPLPAKAFTPEQVKAISDWFRAAGWKVGSSSGAQGVTGINDIGMTADDVTDPYTAKQREKDKADAEKLTKSDEKQAAQNEYLSGTEAGRFVVAMFGDSMNAYNSVALAKVLAGDAKTFEGLFSNRAADVIEAAGIAVEGRKVADVVAEIKAKFSQPQQAQEQAAALKPAKESARLTDAGQELIRNRRGKLKGLAWNDVSDMNDTLKVAQVVKSNVWPRPDYAKMVEDGSPAWKAAAFKAVYDKLAAAPVTRTAPTDADLRDYIETMHSIRDLLTAELDRVAALPDGAELWKSLKAENVFGKAFPVPFDARPMFGRPSPFDRNSEQGKANNKRALLIGGNNAIKALQFDYRVLSKIKDLLAEGFPAKQEAWQKSWEVRATEARDSDIQEAERTGEPQQRFFVYEKGSRWRLAKGGQDGGYATREQAEAFARSLTARKKEAQPPSRGLDLDQANRTGPDWRGGRNVTAQEVMDRFGFRGLNLGEYVKAKQDVAQLHLNHVYDAFSDLADLMGVPPKAMSLNGTLGVAIGAQGSGKALAHFVPGVNEINITRDSGAGALAHEFGHAMDHYFAAQHGRATSVAKRPYLSATVLGMRDNGGVRPEVIEAMREVMKTINSRPMTEAEARQYMESQRTKNEKYLDRWVKEFSGNRGADTAALQEVAAKLKKGDIGDANGNDVETNIAAFIRAAGLKPGNSTTTNVVMIAYRLRDLADEAAFMKSHIPQVDTDYTKASSALDANKTGEGYWNTPWEKFARAFETFVMDALKDRQRESLYLSGLVDGKGWSEWAESTGKSIPYPAGDERLAMQQAFQKLADTIQTKETDDGNVMMFSVVDDSTGPADTADYGPATRIELTDDQRAAVARLQSVIRRKDGNADYVLEPVEQVAGAGREFAFASDIIRDAFGIEVTPVKQPGKRIFNGAQVGDQLLLDVNTQKPAMAVMGHELLHQLRRDDPQLYSFLKIQMERVLKDGAADAYAKKLRARYEALGLDALNDDTSMEELLADIVGDQFGQRGFWDILAKKNFRRMVNLARKVLAFFDKVLATGRDKFPFETDKYLTDIEAAREIVANVLAEYSGDKVGRGGDDGVKFSAVRGQNRGTEAEAIAAGFTMKAYRGVSAAKPFNDTGTTWMTTSREVAEAYAEEVMGYEDPDVLTVMVKPDGLKRHDASRLTDEQREQMQADDFGNPQAIGIYDRSDDHPLGGSRRNVTVIHAPKDAVWVVDDGGKLSAAEKQDQTETAAFKRWFGDSKVVDSAGKPLVVWHGTEKAGFTQFDADKAGDSAGRDFAGIYFTNAKLGAETYSGTKREAELMDEFDPYDADAGNYPVYLSMQNPYVIDFDGRSWDGSQPDGGFDDWFNMDEIVQRAKDDGYDGVIAENVNDEGKYGQGYGWGDKTFVVFKPTQIKSATKNTGTFDPDNADIRFSVADDIKKAIPAFDVKTAPKNTWAHYRGMAMQALGRRQIVDLYAEELPQLAQYDYLVQQMDAEKNDSGAEADKLAQDWGKLRDEKQLAELMHDATLAQIDPAKPMETGVLQAQYRELKARFDALTPEAQALYREARDMYDGHYRKVQKAIKERIERSEMSAGQKRQIMAKMDEELFKKLKGVYFPLARFGQYVIVVKDANGEVKNVTRAETVGEAEEARKELHKAFPKHMGYTVGKVLKQAEFNAGRDAVGKGFMADLMDALDAKGIDDELRDTVAQLYLSSLPDLSWAKHGIHRKGTPGFSQDARRAFAQNMFHGARYLAKLRYADQLQDELIAMQDHVKAYEGVEEYDSIQAQQVVDEMVKRHEIMMNPKSSPVSTALTSLGFVFHLGLSPASAMVNLSQTALVAYPMMGAKWGWGKASAALLAASQDVVKAKNDLGTILKGAELDAYERAVKDGTIDVTMAHDLAGISQGEDQKVFWKIRPVMRAASFMFHHAERFNRQATFIAAWRMAKEAGPDKTADQLYEEAKKLTYDSHFDYSASNRPRVMQGNWQRVIFLFKQYAQAMVYTLSRNAYLSMKGLTPADRALARKNLSGILATHAAAAGVLGLPLVGPLLTAASFIGSDDDEPWDAEVAMQNVMADMVGPKAAEVMARGFSRLTPFDLSGRVALNKLILPDVQEGLEGKQWAESAMAAALGPVAGIGVNMARGFQKITEGHYMTGLEDMMPTALRSPLKAMRYASEGAVDKTGVVITDEVGPGSIAGQALGFSPSEVRRATERKAAIMDYDRSLADRRSALVRQWAEAQMAGDTDGVKDVMAEIQGFNQKNPNRKITMPNLIQSVRARRRRIEQAEDGVYLPKNRDGAREAVRF